MIKKWRLMRLLSLLLLMGCCKTEVLNTPQPMPIDTIVVLKAAEADTTQREDTARVPIGWNPSVEDWEEQDINI